MYTPQNFPIFSKKNNNIAILLIIFDIDKNISFNNIERYILGRRN